MGVGGVYHFAVSDIDSDVTAVPKCKPRNFGERVNRTFFRCIFVHGVRTDIGHTVCAVFDSTGLGVQPAVLRAKECVLKTAACVQENAEDIYAGAKQINDDRAAMDEEFEDESFTEVEDEEETEA